MTKESSVAKPLWKTDICINQTIKHQGPPFDCSLARACGHVGGCIQGRKVYIIGSNAVASCCCCWFKNFGRIGIFQFRSKIGRLPGFLRR